MKAWTRAASLVAAMTLAAGLGLALLVSCGPAPVPEASGPRTVRLVLPEVQVVEGMVETFGSLSFTQKLDITASQDGIIASLPYGEGVRVRAGTEVLRLSNPPVDLAVRRAENGVAQAQGAVELAAVRLREGRLAAEARLLGLEKLEREHAQAQRDLAEMERKHQDQVALHQAGGVSDEALRQSTFALDGARERVALLAFDMATGRLGLRAEDLRRAGREVPSHPQALREALVDLSVQSLQLEFEAAQTRLVATEIERDAARLAQADLSHRASLGGVVAARYVEVGERVKREDKILTIMDSGSLFALAPVREGEAIQLAPGMEARVRVEALDREFEGLVAELGPVGDASSASFTVKIRIRDPQGLAKPGMFATIRIPVDQPREVLVLPREALVPSPANPGEAQVWVVDQGRLQRRTVEIGEARGNGVEVRSGLKADEAVVDRSEAGMVAGEEVHVAAR